MHIKCLYQCISKLDFVYSGYIFYLRLSDLQEYTMQRFVSYLILGFASFLLAVPAYSKTYYIDFDDGNDTDSGTSTSTAWRTIPGTTQGSPSDPFLRRTYGQDIDIDDYNKKIPAGTILKIKAGTTYRTTMHSGAIRISSAFYENGTSNNPIIIEKHSSWGGTGKASIVDASKVVPGKTGLLVINDRDFISIKNISIKRSGGDGISVIGNAAHLVLHGIEVTNNVRSGIFIEDTDTRGVPNYACSEKFVGGFRYG